MNRYRYEAANASGKLESGHLEADSQSAAFASLRSRGLTALLVQVEGNPNAVAGGSLFSAKLSDNDLAWATRQLASLLGASLPLEAALSATVEQAEKKHIAQTLSGVRADVRGGMRLADALAARPRDFPSIYRALIAAGEESGDLAQVMERLADYIEERNNLRGKILTAFIYPGVVGLVSIGIVIFLLSYVVPQVVSAFSQARQDLPGLTLAMLNASDFIRAWGGLCFAALLGGLLGLAPVLAQPRGALELACPGAAPAVDRAFCIGAQHRTFRLDPGHPRRGRRAAAARPGSGASDPVQRPPEPECQRCHRQSPRRGQPGTGAGGGESLPAGTDPPDRQRRKNRLLATDA